LAVILKWRILAPYSKVRLAPYSKVMLAPYSNI